MSRKPQTPTDDAKPAGTESKIQEIAAGRRFTGNADVLEIEKELAAEGRELPNRAIPIEFHPVNKDYTDKERVRELIELETEKDHPNKQLIGLLNEQL